MLIYLIGFMGSGKSTTGKKIAEGLSYDFVDLDLLFEETHHINLPEFFQCYGEKAFRLKEYDLLKQTLSLENTVVATGGGTPIFKDAMELMNQNGTTLYLKMNIEALKSSLQNSKKRPLINDQDDLGKQIEYLLKKREPIYQQAHLTIDPLKTDVKKILHTLKMYS